MIALVFLWHWKHAREGWRRGARFHQFHCEPGYRLLWLPSSENRASRILVTRKAAA